MRAFWLILGAGLVLAPIGVAQVDPHQTTVDAAAAESAAKAPRRTRLYLKDGSFQIVMSYKIVGDNVSYVSAERAGETEVVPLKLVDLDKTKAWAAQHAPQDPNALDRNGGRPAPVLDPELAKEEAERKALAPEVEPHLALNPEYTLLVEDTWHASPELIPLTQSDGELNRQTSHNVVRQAVNPLSTAHKVIVLRGESSPVQIHVNDPVFYLKLDDETEPTGEVLTVDTHGASSRVPKAKPDDTSYVIVRTDVRQDARVVASFNILLLGTGKRQADVIEMDQTPVAGGHWLKLVPGEKLLVGEYALLEVLGAKEINLGVWDFGVHPTAPENRDAIRPELPKGIGLERHP
jgi:hypothetical protein